MSQPDNRARRNNYAAQTTDATVTPLADISIYIGQVLNITAFISARRTGGASGTAGDCAGYELNAVFKCPDGITAVQVGSTSTIANEDDAAWDAAFSVSGSTISLDVTGASGVNISWNCAADIVQAN